MKNKKNNNNIDTNTNKETIISPSEKEINIENDKITNEEENINKKETYNSNIEKEENNDDQEINNLNENVKKINDIILEEKNSEITNLKDNIDILNKEIVDIKLYFRSEIENINKKNLIEIEKIRKFSNENIMIELITVIDNLERTISFYKNNEENNNSIIEGIKLTLKLFISIINKFGLQAIEDINVPFNHDIHQAVLLEYNEKLEENYIIEILQKGYILNGRLIRPAMSKISTKKKENKN